MFSFPVEQNRRIASAACHQNGKKAGLPEQIFTNVALRLLRLQVVAIRCQAFTFVQKIGRSCAVADAHSGANMSE